MHPGIGLRDRRFGLFPEYEVSFSRESGPYSQLGIVLDANSVECIISYSIAWFLRSSGLDLLGSIHRAHSHLLT